MSHTPEFEEHTLHAHISTESVDCDGNQVSTHTEFMNDDEFMSPYGDLDFKGRIATNTISWVEDGRLTTDDTCMVWHCETDEGYNRTFVQWCEDSRCQRPETPNPEEDDMNSEDKTGLHHKIYPYTEQVIQYANERDQQVPWITRDRSTANRNERRGFGRAMTRTWTPGEWSYVNKNEEDVDDQM